MSRKKIADKNQIPNAVDLTIKYLKANFCRDVKLDEISLNVKYNKYYLCRVFKEVMGQTIQSYLLELRMDKAKLLLKQTNMILTEIVYGSGFSSQAYFCHIFKKMTGMTPLQFRNFATEFSQD